MEADKARNATLTVGNTQSIVSLRPYTGRRMFYAKNISTGGQVITLRFGDESAATAGEGVVLDVGEFISDSSSEGYQCFQGTILGIASAAGGTLTVMER